MNKDHINEIVGLISQSSELASLKASCFELMVELRIMDKHVNPNLLGMINITLAKHTPEDCLKHILLAWMERLENSACIKTLISSFENVGYVEIPRILSGYSMPMNQVQGIHYPIQLKSDTNIKGYAADKMIHRAYKTNAEANPYATERDHFLESESFTEKSSKWKRCDKQNRTWCEVLSSLTRRSICKYASIFVLFQLCIALSLHAQLRSFKNQISVKTLDELKNNLQCPNITVSSYIEYQMKMKELSGKLCSVHVVIDLKTKNDWQLGVPLKDPDKISQLNLRGDIPLNLLTSILQESKQLKGLILTLSHNYALCNTSLSINDPLFSQVLNLRNLESITFENVTTCSVVYEFISANAHMKTLESFIINSGVIDDHNGGFIRDILQSHSQRLKTLSFPDSKWNSMLFENNVPVFSYVENIRLDFISDNNNVAFMSTKFSDIFPNLKIFESKKGLMPWIFFQRLLKCRHLTKVVVTVSVPGHYSKPIKMNFLSHAPSSLKHLEISFYFPNKQYTDFCELEGIENERKLFSLLLVKANCKIRHV